MNEMYFMVASPSEVIYSDRLMGPQMIWTGGARSFISTYENTNTLIPVTQEIARELDWI